jgi:hypothetical protein
MFESAGIVQKAAHHGGPFLCVVGLQVAPRIMGSHLKSLSGFANEVQTEANLQMSGHNETP